METRLLITGPVYNPRIRAQWYLLLCAQPTQINNWRNVTGPIGSLSHCALMLMAADRYWANQPSNWLLSIYTAHGTVASPSGPTCLWPWHACAMLGEHLLNRSQLPSKCQMHRLAPVFDVATDHLDHMLHFCDCCCHRSRSVPMWMHSELSTFAPNN